MDRLISVGRIFVALALIGLGVEHFIFQDFITGRAPSWPEGVPGGTAWAYISGAAFILVGAAILFGMKARLAAILAAVLILSALLRHIPVLATDTFLSGEWTKAGKALTFFGGVLAIAATFPKVTAARSSAFWTFVNLQDEFIVLGRVCLGIFLVITGIQHFMYTEFVASLIPSWFPGNATVWTHFAGVALISGGIGLFIPRTAQLAALLSGVMVFSWFWIVHLPRTFVGVSDSIAVFEALAVAGIAFVLAGYLARRSTTGVESRPAERVAVQS